jgi:organic radical activating enzyme
MAREIKILDVFYGNKCNLTCNQCDTRSDYVRKGQYDPTMEDIKRGIDLANKAFNVQKWSILGGEPLLYLDQVEEIIAYIRKIEPNKVIFFPTNGSLLDRHMDRVVKMVKKYRLWVQVCNHFVSFIDQTKSNKVKANAEELAKRLIIPAATDSGQWWKEIMDFNSGSDQWKAFTDRKGYDISKPEPDEKSWICENYGVYYMEAGEFQTIQRFNEFGKPKPFTDNDPEGSYWNSCPSVFCAMLYNKKIYKCAALATLRNFLAIHDSLDDPDWTPYLNYKPVDLELYTEEQAEHFGNTHYCHIDECAMCPNKHTPIRKTEEKVLPLYFKKNT